MDTVNSNCKYRSAVTTALIFISTYFIIKLGKMGNSSLGTVTSSLAFMAFCLYFLKLNHVHLQPKAFPLLLFSLAFIICVFLNGNIMIRKFALISSIILFIFALCKGTCELSTAGENDHIPSDLIQCFVCGIDISRLSKMKGSKTQYNFTDKIVPLLLKILLGLILSSPLFIFALLMLSYDASFVELLNNIVSIDISDLAEEVWLVLCTVPVFLYLYLGIISFTDAANIGRFDSTSFSKLRSSLNWFSPVTLLSMVIPVLSLYTVFFISQWDYYTMAFHGSLPSGYSYAEYAREGFFQLCAVSAVNLLLMLGCTWFSKLQNNRSKTILKAITIAISLYSLILILTAASKMYLYIFQYGLTPLRVYSSWAMIVLTVIFILFIAKQFSEKLPLYSLCIMCTALLFLTLCACDPDTRIAEYNTNQFIEGNLDTVDINLLNELGDSAVPSLIRLNDYYNSLTAEQQKQLISEHDFHPEKICVNMLRSHYSDRTSELNKWYCITMPYLMAKQSLDSYN